MKEGCRLFFVGSSPGLPEAVVPGSQFLLYRCSRFPVLRESWFFFCIDRRAVFLYNPQLIAAYGFALWFGLGLKEWRKASGFVV